MQFSKEWVIEVREDIFNQMKDENYFLVDENIKLTNKIEELLRIIKNFYKWLQKDT